MSRLKKKFGKRILAYLLSGAMIMSNMTAFASEIPNDTGGGYYEEMVDADAADTENVENAESVESSENEDNDSNKQDDVKESSVETVEATEAENNEQTTEASDNEQTSETESFLSTETEDITETESMEEVSTEEVSTEEASTEEASEAETTEVSETEEDVKAVSLTDSVLNEYVDKTVGEWTKGSDGAESRETTWDFSQRRPDASTTMAVNENLQGIVALSNNVGYKVKVDSDTQEKTNEGFGVPKNGIAVILLDSETTSVAVKFTLSGTTSGRKVKIGGVEIEHTRNYDSADTAFTITSDDDYGKYLKIEGMLNNEGSGYAKEGDTKFASITIIETKLASGENGGGDGLDNPALEAGEGKIDVWDFGAEQLDTEKYNNKLTEEIINSWFPDVAPGSDGAALTTAFEVKDSKGELELKWNNAGATNHRLRTVNKNLTRYDEKSLTYNDVTYNGYIYSNKEKTKDVNLQLAVQAGDIVTLVVTSNGKNSTISFESPSGEVSSKLYDVENKDNTAIMTFYAGETGLYKIYTLDEKLCVARIYRERPNIVNVTGSITEVPDNIPAGYLLTFENQNTKAITKAAVKEGKYEVKLQECYKYTVGLSGADEFVVDNGRELDLTEKTGQDRVSDLTIKAVDLLDIQGSFVGLDEGVLSNVNITFENSEKIYQPKLKIENNAYSTKFEKGVTYTVKVADKEKKYVIDDYTLKTETVKADESVTNMDVTFEKKPTHKVTIVPTGDVTSLEDIAEAEYMFYYLDMTKDEVDKTNGYVYTFTDAAQIQLRDGAYQIEILKTGNYLQDRTTNLIVNGADVEKTISFSKENRTEWDFTTDKSLTGSKYGVQIQSKIGTFHGLEIDATTGKFDSKNRTTDAQFNTGTQIKVPVTGPCQVIVSVYHTTYTVNDVPAEEKVTTFDYTAAEAGYVTIAATGNTYLNYIKTIYQGTLEYKDTVQVGADKEYKTINEALDAISEMDRKAEDGSAKRVTVEIDPGNYEEMLVVTQPNVTFKNASAAPGIALKDKGAGIDDNAVRVTWYYGHGYTYYSMGSDCKYDAELLEINKENGYASYINPGAGTTDGSYWNASVVIDADGFEADGIIFENSFNQYISAKSLEDVIVKQSSAKEGATPRTELKTAGDTTVQEKAYVERATALAITNNIEKVSFNNCLFVGRQDVLYGGTGTTAAFYDCDIYGAVDYIFGGMTAVFAKCDLVLNTSDADGDLSYITAPQQQKYKDKSDKEVDPTRGYLMYNCHVKSITPGVDSASAYPSKPSGLGRAWAANTGEAVFYMTIIDATCEHWYEKGASLITPKAWYSGLSAGSPLCTEYGTFEYAKGVDNSSERETTLGGGVLTEEKLKDGSPITVATFLGDWNPFAGKDMEIVMPTEDDKIDNKPDMNRPGAVKISLNDCVIAVPSILADDKKNPNNESTVSVVYYDEVEDKDGNLIKKPVRFVGGTEEEKLDYVVTWNGKKEGTENTYTVTITGGDRVVDRYKIDSKSSVTKEYKVFDKKADKDKIIDLSKAKITLDGTEKSSIYTGYGITPAVTDVKVGKDSIDPKKYKVSYKSNVNAGKATVIVSADSNAEYADGDKFIIGSKTATFTINKAAINKADQITVTALDINGKKFGSEPYEYRGTDIIEIDDLSVVSSGGKTLREGVDYTVTYKNNRKAGKATATIKGIGNNVSGSLNIPFTIKPLNIGIGSEYKISTTYDSLCYSPNGAKLGWIRAYKADGDEIYLEEGVDFKVSYTYEDKKTKKAGTKVTFTGQGTGACTGAFNNGETPFTIKQAYFGRDPYYIPNVYVSKAIIVDITKGDLTGDNLKKALEKAVVVNDRYGKLKLKKDYVIEPREADGVVIIRPSDANNYVEEDPWIGYYYDKAKNIGKMKLDFAKTYVKYYDGRNPVELTADDIKLLDSTFELDTNVEIVEGSYKNNYKAGTASVTIRGISENGYYGTKTIKFKIKEA